MIARDDVRRLRQRVVSIEHQIGADDRELGDGDGVKAVSKVNEPRQHQIAVGVASHQEVVVVGVVMDDAVLETGKARSDLFPKPVEMALHQLASGRLVDVLRVDTELVRALDVPDEIPVDTGMVEAIEGEIEAGEGAADLLEEPNRPFAKMHEWSAVEEGQDPDQASSSALACDRNEAPSVGCRQDPLHEVCDRGVFEKPELLDLTLEDLLIRTRARDLEHPAITRAGDQQEVPVHLAGQRLGPTIQTVLLTGDRLGVAGCRDQTFARSRDDFRDPRPFGRSDDDGLEGPVFDQRLQPLFELGKGRLGHEVDGATAESGPGEPGPEHSFDLMGLFHQAVEGRVADLEVVAQAEVRCFHQPAECRKVPRGQALAGLEHPVVFRNNVSAAGKEIRGKELSREPTACPASHPEAM